jgi:hypothetical protein
MMTTKAWTSTLASWSMLLHRSSAGLANHQRPFDWDHWPRRTVGRGRPRQPSASIPMYRHATPECRTPDSHQARQFTSVSRSPNSRLCARQTRRSPRLALADIHAVAMLWSWAMGLIADCRHWGEERVRLAVGINIDQIAGHSASGEFLIWKCRHRHFRAVALQGGPGLNSPTNNRQYHPLVVFQRPLCSIP